VNSKSPALVLGLNLSTLRDLPPSSAVSALDGGILYSFLKESGFRLVQEGDDSLAAMAGLASVGIGRVDRLGDALRIACDALARGFVGATVHVGTGFEGDAEADALIDDILTVSERCRFPIYVETHRATVTQDPWRTLQLISRFPELRLNGDFSHWYTGAQLTYGDFDAKLDALAPVFERVEFIHGRIGTPGCIQVDIGHGTEGSYVEHFREMWTRTFRAFLTSALPDDTIAFVPELLPPGNFYAPTFRASDGRRTEVGDRWQQAFILARIATESFEHAVERSGCKIIGDNSSKTAPKPAT
jgi:hypothetical protein